MPLPKRQTFTYEIIDDQSQTLMNTYKGNWTHYSLQGSRFIDNTITATPNPGASFSLSFSGTRAYLYGGLLNNSDVEGDDFTIGWPTASYVTDGVPGGSQMPYFDSDNSSVIYFATPTLASGTHTINVTVTAANDTSLYIIDYFLIIPSGGDTSGVTTTRAAPSSTSSVPVVTTQSTPVGAIVGGIVGGIAGIAIVAIAVYYFLFRRSRGGRAYYFEKPGAGDVLSGEDNVEPFNTNVASPPPSSAGFSRPGPQSAYSENSSNQPLNQRVTGSSNPSQYTQPGPSEGGHTHVSGTSAAPRTGKAALISQQYQDVQPPVQFQDSGIRFNENAEEAGPSQIPHEVPPTYTPN